MRAWAPLLLLAACRPEVPVLLWHEVGCGTRDARDVPAAEFEAQLTWLEAHGFHYVKAAEAAADVRLPDKSVALTFDDGAACLYTSAFPILLKHHAPFTLFLPSDWISRDAASRTMQKLEDGEQVPSLDWPEVGEMVRSGLAQIGSHGRTHRYLRRVPPGDLTAEVRDSRAALAALTGEKPDLFAYPFGAFDSDAAAEVRAAGYRAAFAVGNGLGGEWAYRRRSLHRGAGEAGIAAAVVDRSILPFFNHD